MPLEQQPIQQQGIREYLRILRRRRWLVWGTFVGVVFTTWLVSARMTPIFEATAQLEAQPPVLGNIQEVRGLDTGTTDRDLQTQAAQMKSYEVLTRAAAALHLASPDELDGALEVKVRPDTSILEVTVQHREPGEAEKYADAVIAAYRTYRQDRAIEQVTISRDNLNKQIQDVQGKITELDQRVAGNPEAVTLTKSERDALVTRLQTLEASQQSLPGPDLIRSSTGELLDKARAAPDPVRPKIVTNLAVGTAVGLLLAVGLALLTETLADRIANPDEIEERLSTSILGQVPSVKEARAGDQPSLVILDDPVSGAAEAYRTIRTNLRFLSLERPLKTIMLTSAVPGEGKTSTAANMAVAFAQAGTRTILLSADLRKPSAHKFFGVPDAVGLVGALNPEVSLEKSLQATGVKNFRIMAAGGLPPNPTEILGSARFTTLLTALSEASDMLIIDAPPALGLADASALASKVDGVLFVVDTHKVNRRELSHAADQIRRAGGRIVGAVMNAVEPEEGYGYYYPHYYQEIEEEEQEEEAPRQLRGFGSGS
jgi:capsular exopolysaccharide synthesis family protein